MEWQPIETAPKDGRPVWVRGYNFGKREEGEHRCWAWWEGTYWVDAAGSGKLMYLADWMPLPNHQQ